MMLPNMFVTNRRIGKNLNNLTTQCKKVEYPLPLETIVRVQGVLCLIREWFFYENELHFLTHQGYRFSWKIYRDIIIIVT